MNRRVRLTAGLGVNPRGISLNHLIRLRQHRLGDREAQCLRGFQVDHQFELGRLLDGQVAGLGTLENLVDVGRGAPKQIRLVRSIGHKAPASTNSLDVYTAGSRFLAARSTRRLRSLSNLLLGSTVRAP